MSHTHTHKGFHTTFHRHVTLVDYQLYHCLCVCVCVFSNNVYANLMFLVAEKASLKHQKHNLALKSPDGARAVMEAESLPCQDDPSPANKPPQERFDDLDIPYIDAEEEDDDEDEIAA